MAEKQQYAKECINAEDGRLIAKALDELTTKQTKEGAYEGDIRSTEVAKDAINRVLDHASFEHDEICFYVSVGTKKRNIFGFWIIICNFGKRKKDHEEQAIMIAMKPEYEEKVPGATFINWPKIK